MVPCSLPVLPRRFFWGRGRGPGINFDFRACCIFVARAAPCHLQIWPAHHHFKSLSPLCYTLPPAQSCFEAENVRERERERERERGREGERERGREGERERGREGERERGREGERERGREGERERGREGERERGREGEREREGVGAHGFRPIPSTPSKKAFISTICGKKQNCFNTLCAIRSDFSGGFSHLLCQRSPLNVANLFQICFHATLAYFQKNKKELRCGYWKPNIRHPKFEHRNEKSKGRKSKLEHGQFQTQNAK